MQDKASGAVAPRTTFPPFLIGALHIPMQRNEPDNDGLMLQNALLHRRRKTSVGVTYLVAMALYFAGAVSAVLWLLKGWLP